jgi:hypothetical protein
MIEGWRVEDSGHFSISSRAVITDRSDKREKKKVYPFAY